MTDRLDAERIATETRSSPAAPVAFKRAGGDRGPDETAELLALWHNTRRSLTKGRVQLLSEVEPLLLARPEESVTNSLTRRAFVPGWPLL
ncbi:MAG: hypothetical protein LC808_03815 [Actinobacteria bacterium]|nr:hypothetical protein [Actinomycetota bacterium]